MEEAFPFLDSTGGTLRHMLAPILVAKTPKLGVNKIY